ncbi:MAG TPA: SpoIIE family protein phosphatase [Bacillota bacterium]|nr:SpoIIE family protein phosphatase [Bacillota bacterium]
MKFIEDIVEQKSKQNYIVCGDIHICERTLESTFFVLCDGIGSGVYANIAAITCANRLVELHRCGVSMRRMSEMVADSMHRAREEKIPFAAFTAVKILNDGLFIAYTYEAPNPVMIKDGLAIPLKPEAHTAEYEVIGETTGKLELGDSLIIVSDGITQSGLGRGSSFGIGTEGLVDFINRKSGHKHNIHRLPGEVLEMSARMCGGRYEDDSSVAVLHCRRAAQLAVLSGPPAQRSKDKEIVEKFMGTPGIHVVAGSTTTDIVSRELGREVKLVEEGRSFGSPPEYKIEGIDLVTEGSIMLNQAYNILDEDRDNLDGGSPVEKFCTLLLEADVITFFIGGAINEAHDSLIFKQVGVRPRISAIQLISKKLRELGKLVVEIKY